MNKVILGLGILFLIIGLIFVVLDVAGVFISPFNNPFSKSFDLVTQDFVAIAFLVVGIIFILIGKKK
jgi:hypothetical protein